MSTLSATGLRDRFAPLFAEIAQDEREREQHGVPPKHQLARLVDAGFAGLRVPREYGGEDVPLADILHLLTDLAEADVNLAHVWRNHVSFIEDRRHAQEDSRSATWLRRLGSGQIVGGGWSEPGQAGAPALSSRLTASPHGLRLSGTKMYATGSIYADWSTVLATDDNGERVVVLVDMTTPGVSVGDDWDGFGQKLTGSGSVTYTDVVVHSENMFPFATRYRYQHQFYQSALNALLVGISRALERDAADALRKRVRNHPSATTVSPVEDPELLAVFGRIHARRFAAEASLDRSLADLSLVAETDHPDAALLTRSWLSTSATQLVASQAALDSATEVFDALGSSGTSATYGWDRHWRNARTISSHNPRPYRQRVLGDWVVNATDPAHL